MLNDFLRLLPPQQTAEHADRVSMLRTVLLISLVSENFQNLEELFFLCCFDLLLFLLQFYGLTDGLVDLLDDPILLDGVGLQFIFAVDFFNAQSVQLFYGLLIDNFVFGRLDVMVFGNQFEGVFVQVLVVIEALPPILLFDFLKEFLFLDHG